MSPSFPLSSIILPPRPLSSPQLLPLHRLLSLRLGRLVGDGETSTESGNVVGGRIYGRKWWVVVVGGLSDGRSFGLVVAGLASSLLGKVVDDLGLSTQERSLSVVGGEAKPG
ncbi:hypothetical protein Drorol1_Dr00018769 [Drosera rotundifolia]